MDNIGASRDDLSATGESAVGLLVVTHGDMGDSLLRAAAMILGPIDGVASLSLGEGDSLQQHRRQLASSVRRLDTGSGVLVLLDLFGGTPANAAALALAGERAEAVSGVNLPMLIEVLQARDQVPLSELAVMAADAGRGGIRDLRREGRHGRSRMERG